MRGKVEGILKQYRECELPETFRREIDPYVGEELISDIVGPRRSGKTFLMFDVIGNLDRKATLYLNLEDRRLLPLEEGLFNEIIGYIHAEGMLEEHERIYLFLDEIQRFEGWERYVRSIYDEFKARMKIFVSGSSADLMSKEYAQLLTGRHLTARVLPLSFREFLTFKGWKDVDMVTEKEVAVVKRSLAEYLTAGGFPEVVLSENKRLLLSQLFNDILSRDVLMRGRIRNPGMMEEFAFHLASNVSNMLSFSKMTRYFKSRGLKVTTPTLIRYFDLLSDAFLFFASTIFSYSIRDQLQYPRKIYCLDNGIANLEGRDDMGRLCENAVAVELLRRNVKTHYWRSRSGEAVDFIAREAGRMEAIQVSYNISDPNISDPATKEREVRSLLKCMRELDLEEGTIITYDDEGEEWSEGRRIRYLPLWKFLLLVPDNRFRQYEEIQPPG